MLFEPDDDDQVVVFVIIVVSLEVGPIHSELQVEVFYSVA